MRVGRRGSWLALSVVLACAPTTAPPLPRTSAGAAHAAGRLSVHFYDVGQGLAALVELPDGRHILVDAGDSPRRAGCGGECVAKSQHLLAKLREDLRGAPLDALWITHQHSDHVGGAPEVLRSVRVLMYVDNGLELGRAEIQRARQAAAETGAVVRVVDPEHASTPLADASGVRLTPVLPAAWPASCAHDQNECSIPLRVDFEASSVLFTGDAEHDEERLLDTRGAVTLLQVAHHGSDTSTTPEFLSKVRPKYAVISAGKPNEALNRDYCHPRALIVQRLTRLLGGATSGSLLSFDGDRCAPMATEWIAVPTSERLWATSRDGDVFLSTTGDGVFTRDARVL